MKLVDLVHTIVRGDSDFVVKTYNPLTDEDIVIYSDIFNPKDSDIMKFKDFLVKYSSNEVVRVETTKRNVIDIYIKWEV